MNIVELWKRAYELEQRMKVKNLTFDEIKDAKLYDCYKEVLIDLNLFNGYKLYRIEQDEQRNCNQNNQNTNN
ncbi:MAG: hypothetical protein J6T10_00380 [Methanobrevibacter sp.]|nr:hypothetical protein [Methanobrevibacter sp.]